MLHPSDYGSFYAHLYNDIERDFGALDDDALCSNLSFDHGGPISFRKIERAGLYVSCELCSRDDQKPACFGPYELLAQGPGLEHWARTVLTSIAAVSLEVPLDHLHILDISSCVPETDPIQGVLLELYSSIVFKSHPYGILRAIGLTLDEFDLCCEAGPEACIRQLKAQRIYPLTLLKRSSV